MTPTAITFLALLVWFFVLLISIGGLRSALTLSGKRAPNSFDPGGADVSPFSQRLCRAHANFYESFPLIGGLLLYALAAKLTHITDGLAYVLLAARVAQSVVHLVSTSAVAVLVRFALFGVQLVVVIIWLVAFLRPVFAGA